MSHRYQDKEYREKRAKVLLKRISIVVIVSMILLWATIVFVGFTYHNCLVNNYGYKEVLN